MLFAQYVLGASIPQLKGSPRISRPPAYYYYYYY